MKADNVKQWFVYGNVTFIIIAGFWVLYQIAASPNISPERAGQLGAVGIFAGFVGMAIQFITGSEIATRADRSAASNFDKGLAAPTPPTMTVTTSEGPPASTTVTTGIADTSQPATPAPSDETMSDADVLARLDKLADSDGEG